MDRNVSPVKESQAQERRHGYPLITPSASPPVSRSFSLAPRFQRASTSTTTTATPPPTKRHRRTATPASNVDPNLDLHLARKASAMRVWDVWSQLEERYTRRIDEDDIIDLRTNTVIRDRGVLRSLSQQCEIGSFADADANDAGGQTEGEDDVDEIDAFAPEADLAVQGFDVSIPPARELDPEDLEDFLEAEKKRKALYGEEEDGSESSFHLAAPSRLLESDEGEDKDEDEYAPPVDADEVVGDGVSQDSATEHADRLLSEDEGKGNDGPSAPSGDEDFDELERWDIDEASAVYLVESENDADTQVEGLVDSRPSSPEVPMLDSHRRRSGRQIQTVGRQQRVHEETESGHSPSYHSAVFDVNDHRPTTTFPSPELSEDPASSVAESRTTLQVQENTGTSEPRTAHATSPPSSRPKPKPIYKGTTKRVSSYVDVETRPRSPPAKGIRSGKSSPLKPEVVITTRPREKKFSPTISRNKDCDDRNTPACVTTARDLFEDDPPRIPTEAKGKGRALSPPESVSLSKPLGVSKADSAKSTSRTRARSKAKDMGHIDVVLLPNRSKPPAGGSSLRKRKRVSDESAVSLGNPAHSPRMASSSPLPVPGDQDDYLSAHSSAEASSEDSEPRSKALQERRSRSRSRARSKSHAPVYPVPRGQSQFPPPVPENELGAQAQYLLAQAMQHLSYLISATGTPHQHQHGPGLAPPWTPPFAPPTYPLSLPPGPWPPQTPSHRSRHRSQVPFPSSSPAGSHHPSSSSALVTPSHSRHPYPHSYDPAFSGATLPPSSPEPESPISSPDFEKMRPKPLAGRGRSKSRGRRVSFKLDEDSPPRRANSSLGPVRSRSSNGDDNLARTSDDDAGDMYVFGPRSARKRSVRRGTPAAARSSSPSKTREDISDVESASDRGSPMKKFERGQTPGPPSRPAGSSRSAARDASMRPSSSKSRKQR